MVPASCMAAGWPVCRERIGTPSLSLPPAQAAAERHKPVQVPGRWHALQAQQLQDCLLQRPEVHRTAQAPRHQLRVCVIALRGEVWMQCDVCAQGVIIDLLHSFICAALPCFAGRW